MTKKSVATLGWATINLIYLLRMLRIHSKLADDFKIAQFVDRMKR